MSILGLRFRNPASKDLTFFQDPHFGQTFSQFYPASVTAFGESWAVHKLIVNIPSQEKSLLQDKDMGSVTKFPGYQNYLCLPNTFPGASPNK